ncbi:hypothetical protein [Pectobacterium polaris]|uniref:hypothetical protein n=1 Tax=Pectobacterium polaris TaxID=2042057 RepID=UPI001968F0FA|nr:hypothetical protein [Pectobacterium polaris]MBN3216696.1 hypothetical protein [Pectobacterium polaris]
MSYSNVVATISLIVSAAAFALPYWRDHKAKEKAKRKEMLDLFTRSNWFNEGDIYTTPKAHYTLKLDKSSGLSDVYGTLFINSNEKYYEFNGKIDSKGVLETKLRMPIGKTGANIAKVKFTYSEEDDQITYKFEGYIDNKDMVQENSVLDTEQKLWRMSAPV